MKSLYALTAILVYLVSLPTWAAAPDLKPYKIDPAHSRVIFSVSHLGFINMPGHAHGISGNIDFNFKNNEASKVEVNIDAKQLGMDFAPLDQKLQSKEFFNTEKFSVMTFKSTKIDKTGVDTALITGDFTLLGVTKPVMLKVKFNGRHWNKYAGAESAGFSATARLHRSDFGMKAYLPDIGDEVRLKIELEADEIRPEAAH